MKKPIAISCGEPAGIGPEVAATAHRIVGQDVPLIWIGDPRHLPSDTEIHLVSTPAEVDVERKALHVLASDFGPPAVAGVPNPAHASGTIEAIRVATQLCQNGEVAGMCTAPIHKAALINGAGFDFPGHTEFLAHLAGDKPVAMMLACDELRVVPVTIHIPLSQVSAQLTREKLRQTIQLTVASLRSDFAIINPRIAVAGLNPHAGEDGKMGTEEIELITPLLDDLRSEGLDLIGPLSADTMFHADARRDYDAAVCMYHDQALIPIKTLDFAGGVNVTLGLPFVRTSPDHGTAFDIAGKNKADPTSMIAAIKLAASIARARST